MRKYNQQSIEQKKYEYKISKINEKAHQNLFSMIYNQYQQSLCSIIFKSKGYLHQTQITSDSQNLLNYLYSYVTLRKCSQQQT
ncbi:hypothetical protein pb186bvf_014654 [Paramecium bursaria]